MKLTYGNYLQIDGLIGLQKPLSVPVEHDEMLFIIIHQVYELWFKQIIWEIDKFNDALENDGILEFIRGLKRVHCIQRVLNAQIEILETMSPDEFNSFREKINPASGFQSYQFRNLEFKLGLKNVKHLENFKNNKEVYAVLAKSFAEPGVFSVFVSYLKRQGLVSENYNLESFPREAIESLTGAIAKCYKQSKDNYDVYMACEALIELDENLMKWRYLHVLMVERMIGSMRGTGGSAGVKFLQKTLSYKCFPELWSARNKLGSGKIY